MADERVDHSPVNAAAHWAYRAGYWQGLAEALADALAQIDATHPALGRYADGVKKMKEWKS